MTGLVMLFRVPSKVLLAASLVLAMAAVSPAAAASAVADPVRGAAPQPEAPASEIARTATSASPSSELPLLGAMLGAGLPDGATASLVIRPVTWAHVEVGGGYNLISKGVRAGVSLIPFGVGPSATLEAGRFFDGDANGLVRQFAGASFGESAVLQRVGYDFANAHLGLDFGTRRVTFFIHGGMSYIRANVHNVSEQLAGSSGSTSQTTVTFNQDPQVRLFTPSGKLGFIFYIW
jgi:hypothetical protein